jgi:hypothetical protein
LVNVFVGVLVNVEVTVFVKVGPGVPGLVLVNVLVGVLVNVNVTVCV